MTDFLSTEDVLTLHAEQVEIAAFFGAHAHGPADGLVRLPDER